jgi:cytochrome P450
MALESNVCVRQVSHRATSEPVLCPSLWSSETNNCLQAIAAQVREITDDSRGPSKKERPPTIFEDILFSRLPPAEKLPTRIAQESMTVVIAGTHGTSFAIATGIYYLLASASTLRTLKTELEAAIPDPTQRPNWKDLEKLPFLRGVVQEALRLSYGSSARLPRIAPVNVLSVRDDARGVTWDIPPGTPIGMSAFQIHHDESIFPDSNSFLPERWADNPELDRYMVSFTKGSRSCLGINLAYALMYLTFAGLFRVYGSEECRSVGDKGYLELFETSWEDVEVASDGFLPLSRNGSHGLQFKVKK